MASKDTPAQAADQSLFAQPRTLCNNMLSLHAAFRVTRDINHVRAMQTLLEEAMPELKLFGKTPALCEMLHGTSEPKPSDCAAALEDIQKQWPHAYAALGDDFVLYHVILTFRTLEVVFPYGKLPVFFVVCSDLVKKTPEFCAETYAEIGKASISELERLLGDLSAESAPMEDI